MNEASNGVNRQSSASEDMYFLEGKLHAAGHE
jgi:hypothetical protein